MHTINHIGHVHLYPDAFGLEPNSSLLTDAMDEARGGQFVDHPGEYPEDAWYHYDDVTWNMIAWLSNTSTGLKSQIWLTE